MTRKRQTKADKERQAILENATSRHQHLLTLTADRHQLVYTSDGTAWYICGQPDSDPNASVWVYKEADPDSDAFFLPHELSATKPA